MNDNKIKLKPISLKVKTSIKQITKEYNKQTIFLLILSSLLLVVTIFLISIVLYNDSNKLEFTEVRETPKIDNSNYLYNRWLTENNSLFIFGSDLKFAWYDNYLNLENNYYLGTYTYKTNTEALTEMGYSEEEFKIHFPNVNNLENVYSLNIKPTYLYKNHLNITTTQLDENENWWFIIIRDDDGNNIAYNKTLDKRYILKTEQ